MVSGRTIAVVGGGFTGALFALKALRALPSFEIALIERGSALGRGVAYGACDTIHLLNVPVSRAEVGLEPNFQDWLVHRDADLTEAQRESRGDLAAAFVERHLFGSYLESHIQDAAGTQSNLNVIRGEAVRLMEPPSRGVVLADGRTVQSDTVVLALGNLKARPLVLPGLSSDLMITNDPWMPDALESINPSAPVLFVGTGLTMVDVVLKLVGRGHTGSMLALSRHGVLPATHEAGGHWPPFVEAAHIAPLALLRRLRDVIAQAERQGVAWQRVIDALRPSVARVWHNWIPAERRQFLRHIRSRWTSVRHRMAPRVAAQLQSLRRTGQLRVVAGRVVRARQRPDAIEIVFVERGRHSKASFSAARVINCTGPSGDVSEQPFLADIVRKGHAVPDRLGLGIETDDCAVFGVDGPGASWLFALGPLTQPAWWEISAVPEINTQIERLIQKLAVPGIEATPHWSLLADEFLDLGAGI